MLRTRTTICWTWTSTWRTGTSTLAMSFKNEDYSIKDEFCHKRDKDYMMHDWVEKIGNRPMRWPPQFTRMEEMSCPFLIPQAAVGLSSAWRKEGLGRTFEGPHWLAHMPPHCIGGGGGCMSLMCDGHAMLSQDNTCSPLEPRWGTAQKDWVAAAWGQELSM
jgi:hypothetical protein